MPPCLRCAADATVGLLCHECAKRLENSPPLCLEQIAMVRGERPRRPGPALVDQWGRPFHLHGDAILVGRQLEQRGISVFEASVSRHHARLEPVGGRWEVRDLGSSNGTFVNNEPVGGPRTLADGDLLRFGSAAFYFFESTPEGVASAQQAPRRTFRPGGRAGTADMPEPGIEGLESRSVRAWSPSGGGGGIVEVDGERVQLATSQFELFELLAKRMKQDRAAPAPVRGFVRTSELLGSLSWDTAHPADNHLKQLVRRLRKSLEAGGIGDLIESRYGFGYRLRVLPRD